METENLLTVSSIRIAADRMINKEPGLQQAPDRMNRWAGVAKSAKKKGRTIP